MFLTIRTCFVIHCAILARKCIACVCQVNVEFSMCRERHTRLFVNSYHCANTLGVLRSISKHPTLLHVAPLTICETLSNI